MLVEMEFGLNVLERMLSKAFEELKCDRIDCMAYNVNLDYVLRSFEKYPSLSKVNIYSNSERVTVSEENKKKILQMGGSEKIKFFHLPENENIVHAKAYRFWKGGKMMFGAIGSPNFSNHSNQNFESLIYVFDSDVIDDIWTKFEEICREYNCETKTSIPDSIFPVEKEREKIDDSYLEGLWEHQKDILKWTASRTSMIINVPPGTGKTEIALTRVKHIFATRNNTTALILVPTTPLIEQWKERLEKFEIKWFEWKNIDESIEPYFANPDQKAIITLYFPRFLEQYRNYFQYIKISKPNIIVISDECQHWYQHLEIFEEFNELLSEMGSEVYNIGLSATLESFNKNQMEKYIELIGGEQNRYEITLQAFYSRWNDRNLRPILKPIKYFPIKYFLTPQEMEEYKKWSRRVGMESSRTSLEDEKTCDAAIRRAQWVRGLEGGKEKLKEFLASHMGKFNESNSIIFVQTNAIAEEIRGFITKHPGWNEESSAYVYDSSHDPEYNRYAMEQFKKNRGFCLISERVLREGFDLPKISRVVLHGSHTSPRDWLQKIGRAIRYDPDKPESIAEVADVVVHDPNKAPLSMEIERYEILQSVSM